MWQRKSQESAYFFRSRYHMASGWGVTLSLDPQQKGDRATKQRNVQPIFRESQHCMEETADDTERSGMGEDRIQKELQNPKSLPPDPEQPHKTGTVYLGQE